MLATLRSRAHGRLGPLAAVGAAAFTASWAVLGALSDGYTMWDVTVRPYSTIAQPVSGLGLGDTGLWMNSSFVLCGAAIAVGTWSASANWPGAGTRRSLRWARPMVAASGVGMAVCGLFDLESIMLHTLGFVLAAGLAPIGLTLAASTPGGTGSRGLDASLRVAGPVGLVLLGWFFAVFDPLGAGSNEGYAGLVQRLLIALLMVDVAAVGLAGRRAVRTTEAVPAGAGASRG